MTQSMAAASRGESTSPCISRLTQESVVNANIRTTSHDERERREMRASLRKTASTAR